MKIACWFFLSWALGSQLCSIDSANGGRMEKSAGEGVPFKLLNGFLIEVEGRIGPLNHLKFILDTGVTRSVVDQKIADKLQVTTHPKQVLNYNRSAAVKWATFPDVQFGPRHVANVPMLVADLPEFSELARDANALIGFDLLGLSNFTVDYDARKVVFSPFKPAAPSAPVKPGSEHLTELTVELQVQGHPLYLIVDTGLQGMVLFEDRVLKRIPELKFEGDSDPVRFGRHLCAKRRTLPRVHLGTTDRDIRVLVLRGPPENEVPGIDGYFGTALLKARWIEFNIADNNISYR